MKGAVSRFVPLLQVFFGLLDLDRRIGGKLLHRLRIDPLPVPRVDFDGPLLDAPHVGADLAGPVGPHGRHAPFKGIVHIVSEHGGLARLLEEELKRTLAHARNISRLLNEHALFIEAAGSSIELPRPVFGLKTLRAVGRELPHHPVEHAARTHAGRLFGILTPGETDFLVAQAEAEAAGCRIERDGSLVKTGEGRGEPCFILPGHPALSVEQFKGGLGFMVRYGADGNGVDAMRMKLSALGPVSSYENRGSINHYWQDAGMTVVETGHERHGSPVSFLFISKATFEKELERILQEKAEAEAEHRRENETLQKMF